VPDAQPISRSFAGDDGGRRTERLLSEGRAAAWPVRISAVMSPTGAIVPRLVAKGIAPSPLAGRRFARRGGRCADERRTRRGCPDTSAVADLDGRIIGRRPLRSEGRDSPIGWPERRPISDNGLLHWPLG